MNPEEIIQQIKYLKLIQNQLAVEFEEYPSKMWNLNGRKMPFVLWEGKADEEEKFRLWRIGFQEAGKLTNKSITNTINYLESIIKKL